MEYILKPNNLWYLIINRKLEVIKSDRRRRAYQFSTFEQKDDGKIENLKEIQFHKFIEILVQK